MGINDAAVVKFHPLLMQIEATADKKSDRRCINTWKVYKYLKLIIILIWNQKECVLVCNEFQSYQ